MGYSLGGFEESTMRHEIDFRGLTVEGSADYEPATGPTYSCGGTPPSWDVEASSIHLDDVEEFLSWDILSHLDVSYGVLTMVEAHLRLTGKILPTVEALVWEHWEEEILSAMCEAEESYDPYDG